MNTSHLLRATLPHLAIAAALCAGAWLVLVQPKLSALAKLGRSAGPRTVQLTPDQQWQLGRELVQTRSWVGDVERLNSVPRDSGRLFAMIMDLGESHAVRVISLQPATVPQSRSSRTSRPDHQPGEIEPPTISRLELTATGRYEDIAAFIDAISHHSPFFRPRSLQLTPADDGPPPTVTARLGCEILSFPVPAALAQIDEESHAR